MHEEEYLAHHFDRARRSPLPLRPCETAKNKPARASGWGSATGGGLGAAATGDVRCAATGALRRCDHCAIIFVPSTKPQAVLVGVPPPRSVFPYEAPPD